MDKKKHLSARDIADLRRTSVIKFLDELRLSKLNKENSEKQKV